MLHGYTLRHQSEWCNKIEYKVHFSTFITKEVLPIPSAAEMLTIKFDRRMNFSPFQRVLHGFRKELNF